MDLGEEPLDLSKKNKQNFVGGEKVLEINESTNNGRHYHQQQQSILLHDNQKTILLKSSQNLANNSLNPLTRRNYSKEELDRALADIQSGRIGTRRASVLYGIPRSTLRNKVFRLNNQKQQNQQESQNDNQKQKNETKFDELKEKLMSNLSLNYAYEKLFSSPFNSESNKQLKENLLKYTKCPTNHLQPPIQQYLSSAMIKILNEVVNEKINRPLALAEGSKKSPIEAISKDEQSKLVIAAKNEVKQPQSQQQLNLKQKRAKRGQYRKYESDQLNKAVDAVINGLMSVHKAGSHFGVPHSTLEYKVKERNMKGLTIFSKWHQHLLTNLFYFFSAGCLPTSSTSLMTSQGKPNVIKASSSYTPPSMQTLNENQKIKQKHSPTSSSNKPNNIESFSSDNKISFQYPAANSPSSSLLATNYFSASELLRKLYEGVNGGAKY